VRVLLRTVALAIAALAVVVVAALGGCRSGRGEPTAEVTDPSLAPEQAEVTEADREAAYAWAFGAITFEPKARYRVAARVLSSERYYLGWTGDIVPLDLALGWGPLSDPAIDELIDWYQGGRWYFWRTSPELVLTPREIARESANVHIVPSTPNLGRALFALDEDDVVELRGFLVNINGPNGARWKTSLSRGDTGGGSCEVMYVIELIADGEIFR
jgi:hypothetical protein